MKPTRMKHAILAATFSAGLLVAGCTPAQPDITYVPKDSERKCRLSPQLAGEWEGVVPESGDADLIPAGHAILEIRPTETWLITMKDGKVVEGGWFAMTNPDRITGLFDNHGRQWLVTLRNPDEIVISAESRDSKYFTWIFKKKR